MPNYGFAIDLRKCIGCHACTIACKAEHDIPVGVNRCWVKTVEKGTFPDVRRFFFPVLCNQCDAAPCVRICPTNALFKRRDGIVDLNADSCIGCRACMEACPYDQLFIDPGTRTAEKCNFCANRVENRLLPACVSVCPTECRIFGDLDDPTSELHRIAQAQAATVRKPEKGTLPKVFYIGAEESAIVPEVAARPFQYKEGQVIMRPLAAPAENADAPGDPRVDYDVPHAKPWGLDMALYLVTKGIATGAMLLTALLWWLGHRDSLTMVWGPALSVVFTTLTAALLVADLERPERFFYILTRPNWRSWMVWGAWFLTAHGLVSGLWLVAGMSGMTAGIDGLVVPALVTSVLATSYTGFLFAQGVARDLWQGWHSAIDLLAEAAAQGAAALLLIATLFGIDSSATSPLVWALFVGLTMHLLFLVFENLLVPSPTRHHELAVSAIRRGAFASPFWGGAILGGGVLPLALLAAGGLPWSAAVPPLIIAAAAVLAVGGAFAWGYVWIEAGQSVPLS